MKTYAASVRKRNSILLLPMEQMMEIVYCLCEVYWSEVEPRSVNTQKVSFPSVVPLSTEVFYYGEKLR